MPRPEETFPRLRRDHSVPAFVRDERAASRRYIRAELTADGVVIAFRFSRWGRVGWDEPIKKRTIFAWALVGGQRMAAVEFAQYRPEMMENEDFAFIMDMDNSHEAELGIVLCDSWPELTFDIGGYGDFLEWEFAWTKPREPQAVGLWLTAGEWVISRLDDEYSIIVLKAFPLEYEGCAPPGTEGARALRRRQRALVRLYRRLLGVRPLPGRHGREGWLWRARPGISRYLRRPIFDPSWL